LLVAKQEALAAVVTSKLDIKQKLIAKHVLSGVYAMENGHQKDMR
jgi:hypothetical protein